MIVSTDKGSKKKSKARSGPVTVYQRDKVTGDRVPVRTIPEYTTYMESKKWARKKVDYFSRYPKRCAACWSASGIHLHHVSYVHFGDEPDDDLIPLCQACHTEVHQLYDRRRDLDLITATVSVIERRRRSEGLPTS